jgi:asparagine synthase (glutamine-hydrolysing)
MAVSLEVREPFFDHDLVEYVLQIPDKLKYPEFPKQLLVEALGDLLPPEIVHRQKKGFTFPWEHWMRNELKEFSATHIHSLAAREFMHHDYTIALWNDFLNRKKYPMV